MTTTSLTTSRGAGRAGDKVFSGAALAAGCLILAVLFGVALFLVIQAIPALTAAPDEIQGGEGFFTYIWPIVIGTLIAAPIALVIATPIAIGVALFISHFAPRELASGLGYVVDLLAAIPSVVYGAWGAAFLAKEISPAYNWLANNMGWLPIFQGPASATGKTILTAGIVLAVMVLPIITSLTREIFLQTPKLHEEAALALGATRWEMIRMAVLPFGRPESSAPSCWASAAPSAKPWPSRWCFLRRPDRQPDPVRQPDHRRRNRAELPRGQRTEGQHADRRRPGPVRHHPRREHDRPLDHQPAQRILGSQLMTATLTPVRSAPPSPRASCPKSAPYVVLGIALVLGAAILALIGFNAFGWGIVSAILFAAGLVGWSAPWKARRKAKDNWPPAWWSARSSSPCCRWSP